jgi:hypothetical protein
MLDYHLSKKFKPIFNNQFNYLLNNETLGEDVAAWAYYNWKLARRELMLGLN